VHTVDDIFARTSEPSMQEHVRLDQAGERDRRLAPTAAARLDRSRTQPVTQRARGQSEVKRHLGTRVQRQVEPWIHGSTSSRGAGAV